MALTLTAITECTCPKSTLSKTFKAQPQAQQLVHYIIRAVQGFVSDSSHGYQRVSILHAHALSPKSFNWNNIICEIHMTQCPPSHRWGVGMA